MKPLNEMTAEELIEQFDSMHIVSSIKDTYEIALALRNKLKEASAPNPDEIRIVWSVEDVQEIAKQKNLRGEPTVEQAREVLRRIKANHDAEIGITWITLEYVTYEVLGGR